MPRSFTKVAVAFAALLAAALIPAVAIGSGGISTGGGTGGGSNSSKGEFPIKGSHTYGDGLGAGRGHQGQDLLAKCGKRIVAAEGGRVRRVDYQASGAGNYVVVKGKRFDYVYMHMLGNVAVSKGDRLQTGDPIGKVGTTGSSTACHLHFEMWSKPGWYRGGNVINPTPFLKRWDHRG